MSKKGIKLEAKFDITISNNTIQVNATTDINLLESEVKAIKDILIKSFFNQIEMPEKLAEILLNSESESKFTSKKVKGANNGN